MVDFNSANTLSCISWQDVQNFSVLVTSSAVLNAPQKITPATKPPSTNAPSPNTELGRISTSHSSRVKFHARLIIPTFGGGRSSVLIAVHPARRGRASCRYRRNHCSPADCSRSVARGTVQKKRRGDTEARNSPSRSMKWVIETIGACDSAVRACAWQDRHLLPLMSI